MQNNKGKSIFAYITVAIIVIFGFAMLSTVFSNRFKEKDETPKYSEFISHFDNYEVNNYVLDLDKSTITYKLIGDEEKEYNYKIPNLTLFLDDIENYRVNFIERYGDSQTLVYDELPIKEASVLVQLIPSIILVVLLGVFFVIIMRQAQGGGKISNFAKANVKQAYNNKVTFEDVAGCDEEKEELAEVIEFLKDPKKFTDIGARVPKGVLLLGPPGTGKTLLAKAAAGEAKVPFFSISGSDFVEMFVGVGASRVRDLFAQAIKNSPSIIFIDEIDAVGRQRGTGLGGGHDEREQTLNQLLVEMDGFTPNQNVIVMAATNRSDILDPALLRPGRFDRQIVVNYPDVKGREEILKVHTKNKPLAPDVDLKTIAKTTVGFTGAELENLVNEAALLAARHGRKAITEPDIEEATIKVVAGPEKKSRQVTERDKKITAYHEAGHAICTYHCDQTDKVHQVSIIPRGMAGGYTMSLPENDKSYVTKGKMLEELITLLGGRAAEKIFLDDITTGASNDIERATSLAKSMVKKYGFSEKLGTLVYGHDTSEVFLGRDFSSEKDYSEEVAAEIDAEIRNIVSDAFATAEGILTEYKDEVVLVAEYLIEHEKIDGDDFYALLEGRLESKVTAPEKAEETTAETIIETTETTPETDSEE